jgi:hypothetical protein
MTPSGGLGRFGAHGDDGHVSGDLFTRSVTALR